eukprot:Nk52_evm44s151 gene=Nk52_evmTU44s151
MLSSVQNLFASAKRGFATLKPFHYAFPVQSLSVAREFYGDTLGCVEGRSSKHWVDFDLFGHQIVAHIGETPKISRNMVDGDNVPVPHFGVVLDWDVFETFSERLKSKNIDFILEPRVRFEGKPAEQYTMFFMDPFGNSMEFKAMRHPDNLFAKYEVQ